MAKSSGYQNSTAVLDGILTAFEWDASGNAIAVKLLTFDDDEYLLENGDPLLNLLKRTVRVSGKIGRNRKGIKTLKVETYGIVE